MVVGSGTVRSFFPFPCTVNTPGIEIEVPYPQLQALKEAEPAAKQEFHHEIERVVQVGEYGINLRAREHHRDVQRPFGTRDVAQFAEFPLQTVAVEKQKGIEDLVLGGRGNMALHCEIGQVFLDIVGAKFCRRLVLQEPLKLSRPVGISLEGIPRVVANLYL